MLEPGLKNVTLAADAVGHKDRVLDAVPADGPVSAPLAQDMHITIVILPALQQYASRIAHGVKSRAWGPNHDGLSFRIEKIAFLDEGDGAGEEKHAAVRKGRIAASVRGLEENVPPVRLRMGQLKRPAIKSAVRPAAEVVAVA